MIAPAGSAALPAAVAPSVSAASADMPRCPEQAGQRQRVFLIGPPRPWPRTVTVSSPPDRIAARLPCLSAAARAGRARRRPRAPRLEVGAEIDDRVAGVACDRYRGVERRLRRDQLEPRARKSRVAGLAAFVRGLASARATASSSLSPYFATMARASASVVGSGTVGPRRSRRSSCGTSEIASVTISASFPARQPAALDPRQMLADGVDLAIGAPERNSARSAAASARRKCRRPGRSSWPSRRRTTAPATDRRRRRLRRDADFPPRPLIRPRRAWDGRLRYLDPPVGTPWPCGWSRCPTAAPDRGRVVEVMLLRRAAIAAAPLPAARQITAFGTGGRCAASTTQDARGDGGVENGAQQGRRSVISSADAMAWDAGYPSDCGKRKPRGVPRASMIRHCREGRLSLRPGR